MKNLSARLLPAPCIPLAADAQDRVLNLCSARNYRTDEKRYENITRQTGIRIEGASSPAVPGLATDNPGLSALGKFKADALPVAALAKNVAAAQRLLDRAGYR